jgi:chemotaxis protein MotB
MRTWKGLTGLALAIALPMGCVSSGDHEAVLKDLADTQAALKGEKERATDLEQALADEKNKAAGLDKQISELETNLKAAEEAKAALDGENAELKDQVATQLKDKSRLKASVDEMKEALKELKARKAAADKRIAEFKKLLAKFKALIDAGKLRVKIVDGRMVVELATDILFASGSARLSKEGKEAIAEVAAVLASIPDRRFQVEGHTDNVPIKTAQYPSNWELAAARAVTVVKSMVEAGMPAERLSAASFGEHKPAGSNETKEGKAGNRRIEIVVVPDLSGLPGFDELQKASSS